MNPMTERDNSEHDVMAEPVKGQERRRNGMWNIFKDVDPELLSKTLGISHDSVRQMVSEDNDAFSDRLTQLVDNLAETSSTSSPRPDCLSGRARIQRSFSVSLGEEIQATLKNRQRRNAVGNLFEVLSLSQRLTLVENLQEQLEKLHDVRDDSSRESDHIILALSDLSLSTSTKSTNTSPRSHGEIVCR